MLHRLRLFLELVRFSHTVFALPFALLSAVLAWQSPGVPFRWTDLAGIVLCMVFARSAAMAVNRLADRRLDAANPRTAGRHLPAGLLSVPAVAAFLAVCVLGFFASTLLFLLRDRPNWWPLILAGPVLAFVAAYSLTKRFTALAHFWLGASLMLAPVAAWIAIRGMEALLTPAVLGLAVLFWVAGFDILYACQDVDVDRRLGLYSVPARLGVPAALRVAMICHALTAGLLVALYFVASPPLGGVYLAGVAAVAALLIYEHSLVRPDDLSRVNRAFFQVNGVISIGLFLLVLLQLAVGW
ncbi:MAG TPA: UbiA-like polyprenyltransferase [Gemmataceae bacterium]|jgi:4-hydroxybenzoate polyprenyltransferase